MFIVASRKVERVLKDLEFLAHAFDVVDFDGVIQGGANGAQADFRVGVLEGIGQDKHGLEHDALKLATGQVCGFFMESRQFVAEIGVVQPAMEGPAAYVGEAGGLGDGGCGCEYRQRPFLPGGKAGFSVLEPFCAIVRHGASVAGGGLGSVLTRLG